MDNFIDIPETSLSDKGLIEIKTETNLYPKRIIVEYELSKEIENIRQKEGESS